MENEYWRLKARQLLPESDVSEFGKTHQEDLAAKIPMDRGNKRNAMKKKTRITQQEIAAALQQFISRGGVINHLPDQKYQSSKMIGDEKYQVYESFSGLSEIASIGDLTP